MMLLLVQTDHLFKTLHRKQGLFESYSGDNCLASLEDSQ